MPTRVSQLPGATLPFDDEMVWRKLIDRLDALMPMQHIECTEV